MENKLKHFGANNNNNNNNEQISWSEAFDFAKSSRWSILSSVLHVVLVPKCYLAKRANNK